ncbi:FAD-dependent oxidoreductase [Sciscionella marina]|uniref:FAD-dependent oxidoreductase n=1 Tax=Sciscionella marina TaxID=508770 RepID=UPI0003A2F197|nr:NAD(P)/FAD-dependent oxidoreductase [Sciscionella marina]
MRVVVIGAGLGGLCLAQGLRGAGIEVQVYERDAGVQARFQGYRIGLGGPGLEALRRCLPPRLRPLLDAIGGELSGEGRVVDPGLRELGRIPEADEGLLFDRHVLRHLLLHGLADRVHFGKSLNRYRELSDGTVRAEFADGSTASGDVLVGADGMGSTVRRQLLPSVEILDTGVSGVIGRTTMNERFAALVPGWSTLVQGEHRQLFLGKMPFHRSPHLAAAELAPDVFLPETASYLRWVMLVPAGGPIDLQREYAGQDGIEVVLDLIHDWHPDLRELIRQGDRRNSGVGPIRYAKPYAPWQTRAVTLLGDSAHPLPPGGLGANLAFADAERLTTTLGETTDLRACLATYEDRMRTAAATVYHEAMAKLPIFEHLVQDR